MTKPLLVSASLTNGVITVYCDGLPTIELTPKQSIMLFGDLVNAVHIDMKNKTDTDAAKVSEN